MGLSNITSERTLFWSNELENNFCCKLIPVFYRFYSEQIYRFAIRVFDWAGNRASPQHICPRDLIVDQTLRQNQTYSLDRTDSYANKYKRTMEYKILVINSINISLRLSLLKLWLLKTLNVWDPTLSEIIIWISDTFWSNMCHKTELYGNQKIIECLKVTL